MEKRRDYLPGVAGSKKREQKSAKELGVEKLKDFDPNKTSTPDVRAALHEMKKLREEADQDELARVREEINFPEGTGSHKKTESDNEEIELEDKDMEDITHKMN